jgi:HAD superfamily hydrolase (TIGR01450 family)
MAMSPAEYADVALLDLDGVVYVGASAVDHAVDSLAAARQRGLRLAFVTNNASRPPMDVAAHLRELGVHAPDDSVVTSAQAGARIARRILPAGSPVLAIGGPGLDWALQEQSLSAVRSLQDNPLAVMQGFGRNVDWAALTEGCFAVTAGLPWIATNLDPIVPLPDGFGPGNGAFVRLVAQTTGRSPDHVAGKPERALMDESIIRTGATRPLVIGDRLDTDIEGARRAGIRSMLVLTGVTDVRTLLMAPAHLRPDLICTDLRGLLETYPEVVIDGHSVVCGGARAWRAEDASLRVDGGSPIDQVRAAAVLAWSERDAGRAVNLDSCLPDLALADPMHRV